MRERRSIPINTWITLSATALLALLVAMTNGWASDTLIVEGDIGFEDLGRYLVLPFDVPEGTTTIGISYSYTIISPTAETNGFFDPVLDIGIYDPEKFRGWTGSDLSSFVISESRDLTTDGYAPGEIPAGEWTVELGVALIYPDMVFHYTVQIELGDEPVGEPFVWPQREDVVVSEQARWYMGDLHCHSSHSGKGASTVEIFDYASSIGLDFVAVTDHNNFSHRLYLGEEQAAYPNLLLLYGEELTTYRGHANVFNIVRPVDYHGTAPGYNINEVIEGIHHDGGYISPNHPGAPFVRVGSSYIGWGWAYPETDVSLLDFYEVVNGPSVVFDWVPNLFNEFAILQWEGFLSNGHRITAIGGSDDHQAGQGSDPLYSPLGIPATMVYAEELSSQGIFDAIKAGHVYIIAEGPQGPKIDFRARCDSRTAMVGDTIAGREIDFQVTVSGGLGRSLNFWKDGIPWMGHYSIGIDQDPFVYTFTLKPVHEGRIRLEVRDGLYLSALTNPIYYAPGPSGWEAAHTQASTLIKGAGNDSGPANIILMFVPAVIFLLAWRSLPKTRKE